MQIKPFKAVYPNFNLIEDQDHFSETVRENFTFFKEKGVFEQCEKEAIFVYEIEVKGKKYAGIIAQTDIQAYLDGKILKHENTIVEKEKNQIELTKSRNAIVKPILLTYPNQPQITNLIHKTIRKEPIFYEVFLDNNTQKHTFWKIENQKYILILQELFKEHLPKSYIADGHHRLSILQKMYEQHPTQNNPFQYFMSAFFSSSQLDVLAFHRILKVKKDFDSAIFLEKLQKIASIEELGEAQKPRIKSQLSLFINQKWYKVRWRSALYKKFETNIKTLDTQMLNELVFKHILHIEDIRNCPDLTYVEGFHSFQSIENKVKNNPTSIAFVLHPIPIQNVFDFADKQIPLPPKSTCFIPRIKNGLLVQEF